MRRFLIIISFFPIIASIALAHLLGWRVLNKKVILSLSLGEILEALKAVGINHTLKKKVWLGAPLTKQGLACIEKHHLNSREAKTIAAQLLNIGLSEIYKTHSEMVQWRCKILKAGYFFPPFVLFGGIFAVAVNRLPAGWFVFLFMAVMAACCIMLWLSRAVEKEAAQAVIGLLERHRIVNRLSEEEALTRSIHAWTWVHLLPGVLASVIQKNRQDDLSP